MFDDTYHDIFDDQEQEGKEAKDDEDDREEDQNQQAFDVSGVIT